ncbi:MAG TPA: hypothetical protein VL328_18325 [Gemmatimonadaceae bacterium]|jgi:hypothetical protein|nr:hypothetical protein [Gemmatimonadaceae bacterium]
MYFRLRTAISVAALAVVAGACGSDSPTQPATRQITLNQALAELDLPALNAAATTAGGGVSALAPTFTAARCPYSASAGKFVCTTVNSGTLTIDQSFALLTAQGASQAAFDAASTDAVEATTTFSGSDTDANGTYTVDGSQELTLSGLQSDTHTLDGTGTLHLVGDNGAGTVGSITVTETITGLKIPAGTSSATAWPQSGTVSFESSSDDGQGTTVEGTITITFNGTSTAHVTTVFGGVTQSCDVDLSNPNPSCS